MKKLLPIFFILISINTYSTQYYVSASGNDSNNGTSTSTPFKTIAKVNTLSLVADDIVSFHGGDTFYGSLTITHSGTSGHPIIYNSYGTGNAIITGFTSVTGFTNLGSNIWESSSAVSTLSTCNMVAINGINTAMGRTPNANTYYNIDSHVSFTSITSSSINSAVTNWTGATICYRPFYASEDLGTITSSSGSTLNYTYSVSPDAPGNGFGFFIENDIRTLDVQNEWYYNPTTKKIDIYSTSSPSGVQVATVTDLISNTGGFDYLTIDGLTFTGANNDLINNQGSTNGITIRNCTLSFCGNNGIESAGGSLNHINNDTISNVGKAGMYLGATTYVGYNLVTDCGIVHGQSNWNVRNIGIYVFAGGLTSKSDVIIEHNTVKRTGSDGIALGSQTYYGTIQYNFVDSAVMSNSDNGGIYKGGNNSKDILIDHNIVLHSVGYLNGTPNVGFPGYNAVGIYGDEGVTHTVWTKNSSAYNGEDGFKLHSYTGSGFFPNSDSNRIDSNTFYGNGFNQILIQNNNSSLAMYADTMRYNTSFSRLATEKTLSVNDQHNAIPGLGVFDYNYYARPIDSNLIIQTQVPAGTTQRNLPMWKTYSGLDANSKNTPALITNTNQLFFAYNPTNSDSTIAIPAGSWKDVTGASFATSTVLHPFTSVVLISVGSLITPTINWTPAALTYPNGLGPSQLNAIAKDGVTTVSGTHSYSPGAGYVPGAGSINVIDNFTPTDGATYSTATKTVAIPVAPESASLAFSDTVQTYTGANLLPTLTTTPAGIATSITLSGVTGGKKDAGTYPGIGAITDDNYSAAPITTTFTILKATATINAVNQTFYYDGNSDTISYTTYPLGLHVTHTYSSGSAPSAIGTYTDTLRMVEANYSAGEIVRSITIISNPAVIFISDTIKTYNGSPQGVTITCAYSVATTYNGSSTVPTAAGYYFVISTINDGIHTGADSAYLTILPKQAVLSFSKPANVAYGTKYSVLQETASADVPGTWNYSFTIGDIIPLGKTNISATFTPSSSNYSGGTVYQVIQCTNNNKSPSIYITPNYFKKVLQ